MKIISHLFEDDVCNRLKHNKRNYKFSRTVVIECILIRTAAVIADNFNCCV